MVTPPVALTGAGGDEESQNELDEEAEETSEVDDGDEEDEEKPRRAKGRGLNKQLLDRLNEQNLKESMGESKEH